MFNHFQKFKCVINSGMCTHTHNKIRSLRIVECAECAYTHIRLDHLRTARGRVSFTCCVAETGEQKRRC